MSAKKKKNPNLLHEDSFKDSDTDTRFSPVKSPPSPYTKQGQLQGSARKIKDGAADWHNGIMKWNALNTEGMKIINKIANIKLEKIFAQQNDDSEGIAQGSLMSPELEPLCEALTVVVQSMGKVVNKMKSLTVMLAGVKNLEISKYGDDKEKESVPLFQNWSLREFEETFVGLCEMYTRELELKQTLCQNVAHARDRNLMMGYTSSWLHQPYIEARAELWLESMLIETGHK